MEIERYVLLVGMQSCCQKRHRYASILYEPTNATETAFLVLIGSDVPYTSTGYVPCEMRAPRHVIPVTPRHLEAPPVLLVILNVQR